MSLRLRLALWYAGFLAAMFLLFAPAVYLLLERELLQEADHSLAPFGERLVRSLDLGGDPSKSISVRDSDLEPFAPHGIFVEVLDPSNKVIARSPNLEGRSLPITDIAFSSAWWGMTANYTASLDGTRYRGYLVSIRASGDPKGFILVARSLDSVDDSLARLKFLLLVGNAVGLLAAVAIGWIITRTGLQPIEEITQAAQSIALSRDFSRRLKVDLPRDEVGQLAVTFNEMLDSLEEAHAAQRRFVADASHELRSPLTSIRSNIDILRRALDAPREDREEALADVSSELDRVIRLTSDLLLLARADAGQKIEMGRVALDDVVRDVRRQMEARADGIALELGTLDTTVVRGSAVWLKQLLLILVDNALKYTPRGGTVTLSVESEAGQAVARVSDTGIGIAEEDLPHIFERFYRADKARARDEGGSGLGLAVAQWIAEQHNGELTVESRAGQGTTFSLYLPLR